LARASGLALTDLEPNPAEPGAQLLRKISSDIAKEKD
jgi:hypothetical protein